MHIVGTNGWFIIVNDKEGKWFSEKLFASCLEFNKRREKSKW